MKITTYITAAALTLSSFGALAQSNRIQVEFNGKKIPFGTVQPVRRGGVSLIPLRPVLEKMGGQLRWEPATHTIWVTIKDDFSARVYPGRNLVQANERAVTLDAAPRIINGQTMVPLQFFQNVLGVDTVENLRTGAIVMQGGTSSNSNEVSVIRRKATPARISAQRRAQLNAYNRNRILADANYRRFLEQQDYNRYLANREDWEQAYRNYLTNAQAATGVFQGYPGVRDINPYDMYLYNQDFNVYLTNPPVWQSNFQQYRGVVVQSGAFVVPNAANWQTYLQARNAMIQQMQSAAVR